VHTHLGNMTASAKGHSG